MTRRFFAPGGGGTGATIPQVQALIAAEAQKKIIEYPDVATANAAQTWPLTEYTLIALPGGEVYEAEAGTTDPPGFEPLTSDTNGQVIDKSLGTAYVSLAALEAAHPFAGQPADETWLALVGSPSRIAYVNPDGSGWYIPTAGIDPLDDAIPWVAGGTYAAGQIVSHDRGYGDGVEYFTAEVGHVASASFETDFADDRWVAYTDTEEHYGYIEKGVLRWAAKVAKVRDSWVATTDFPGVADPVLHLPRASTKNFGDSIRLVVDSSTTASVRPDITGEKLNGVVDQVLAVGPGIYEFTVTASDNWQMGGSSDPATTLTAAQVTAMTAAPSAEVGTVTGALLGARDRSLGAVQFWSADNTTYSTGMQALHGGELWDYVGVAANDPAEPGTDPNIWARVPDYRGHYADLATAQALTGLVEGDTVSWGADPNAELGWFDGITVKPLGGEQLYKAPVGSLAALTAQPVAGLLPGQAHLVSGTGAVAVWDPLATSGLGEPDDKANKGTDPGWWISVAGEPVETNYEPGVAYLAGQIRLSAIPAGSANGVAGTLARYERIADGTAPAADADNLPGAMEPTEEAQWTFLGPAADRLFTLSDVDTSGIQDGDGLFYQQATNTFVFGRVERWWGTVANTTDIYALPATSGDEVYDLETGTTWKLTGADPTVPGDWTVNEEEQHSPQTFTTDPTFEAHPTFIA